MIGAFITANLMQIVCGGTFLTGFSIYSFFKLKGKRKYRLVYYNVSDKIIKTKKISQRISEKAGGNNGKGDTFFKSSK